METGPKVVLVSLERFYSYDGLMKTESKKCMQLLIIGFLCLVPIIVSAQPLMISTNFNSVDFNGDGVREAVHNASVSIAGSGSGLQVFVDEYVGASFGVAALRESVGKLYFDYGVPVSPSSPVNGSLPQATTARLVNYASNQNRFLEWLYIEASSVDSPRDRLTVYIGLRFPVEGGVSYGWLKFVRPNAQLPTLFTLDSYDWNPIPNAPIRAGLPPEIPIQPEWLPDGQTLRFTWPVSLTSWVLETTPSLTPPVIWEAVESGGGYADVSATEQGRFFRLRRP